MCVTSKQDDIVTERKPSIKDLLASSDAHVLYPMNITARAAVV